MEIGKLGSTNIDVTPLCMGTAALGSMEADFGFTVPEAQALKTLQAAFKSPINFFDTSSNYGQSEVRIGKVLKGLGGLPGDKFLQTKVDWDLTTGDFSADQIRRSFEQSIRLLGVSNFPFVYLHDVEFANFSEVMDEKNGPYGVLRKYQDQGVIDHIGVSGAPISLMMSYVETDAFAAIITACRYTLLYNTAEPLIEAAHQRGMAVLNASPFGSGLLADQTKERYAHAPADKDLVSRVVQMKEVCRRFNVPLKAAALQFSVSNPHISSTIIGPTTPNQVKENIALLDVQIPDEIWPELAKFTIIEGGPQTDQYKKLGLPFID